MDAAYFDMRSWEEESSSPGKFKAVLENYIMGSMTGYVKLLRQYDPHSISQSKAISKWVYNW